jgi:hypothetical protein
VKVGRRCLIESGFETGQVRERCQFERWLRAWTSDEWMQARLLVISDRGEKWERRDRTRTLLAVLPFLALLSSTLELVALRLAGTVLEVPALDVVFNFLDAAALLPAWKDSRTKSKSVELTRHAYHRCRIRRRTLVDLPLVGAFDEEGAEPEPEAVALPFDDNPAGGVQSVASCSISSRVMVLSLSPWEVR